jgi:acyl-CoA dehydrogenase
MAAILEEVSASGGGLNAASSVHLPILPIPAILAFGSEQLRREVLPKIATGELFITFGVTEPDAGTDTTSITTAAHRVDGGYHVRGRKVWTTKALFCQKVLLLVRTTPLAECAKRTDGMTLLLADLQQPEVDIRPIPKVGRNAVVSCEVRYDDLFVAEADRVGDEGRGFHYLLDGLNPERILVAAEALGIGRAAIRKAVQYANDRVVFGRPIGQNQGIAFPLAQSHAALHAAELVIREASWRYDNGLPCAEHANTAKLLAAEAAFDAADRAMQAHGGMGYAEEYDVGRYWREARLMKIAPISQEMVLNYIAEHVLGLPRSY